MKRNFVYVAFALLMGASFSACNSTAKKAESTEPQTQAAASTIDTIHTSRTALDYEGTYAGTLPGADNLGIDTELMLKGDQYTLKTVYLGEKAKGNNTFTKNGKFAWDNAGRCIILDNDSSMQYQVGENQLFALDRQGQRITGKLADKYILKKK